MHPIDDLMQDHRTIEKALAALEWTTSPRSVDFYEQAADFIAHFADQYHHEKEEQLLFPALAAHGIPAESGPIGCMLHDHEAGRTHLGRMRMAIAAGDRGAAAQAGADYAALLRAHIAKEDGVLFEMAREILPVAVIDELALKFEAVGSRTPRRDHYRQLADEMLASVC
jgi:hemerythrin-like domain-containing protein